MNPRIRELMNQAMDLYSNGYVDCPELNPEKFARLIVQECIGCCEQVISDPVPESVDTWLNGGSQCIDEIRKHFGVEL